MMGGEACGLGEGTHYGCECVMRRLAETEARASGLESALAVAGEENAALTESRDAALRSLASEQARRETAEREREQLRESARIAAEAHRKEGDRALAAETSLSAALRRAEDAEHFRDSLTAALKDALDQREALARSREEWMARCQEKSNDKVEAIERAEAAESRAEALEKALRAMLRLWDGDLHGDDFWRARAKAINDAEALLAPRTGGDAADERSGA
jgi:chromosome segregation ATPase